MEALLQGRLVRMNTGRNFRQVFIRNWAWVGPSALMLGVIADDGVAFLGNWLFAPVSVLVFGGLELAYLLRWGELSSHSLNSWLHLLGMVAPGTLMWTAVLLSIRTGSRWIEPLFAFLQCATVLLLAIWIGRLNEGGYF
ncbi:hypothetical protein [Roseobacter sp. A03A-229]